LRLRNTHPESPYTPTKGQSSAAATQRFREEVSWVAHAFM
jgi:hypothetical protein